MNYKRMLAAGTAIVLGAGFGFATSGFAQVTGGPTAPPGNPPTPPGVGPTTSTPGGETLGSNFRRDASIAVMQHPREGYEARGIRMGTLLVYPKLSIAAVHDDNIFALPTNEVDDVVWHVTPQVAITSDWIRHALQVYAQASFNRFQDHKDENTTDYGIGATGRLDVAHDTQIISRWDFTRGTEPRTSPNSPSGAAEPVRYELNNFEVQGRHEFNWLLATGRVRVQQYDYTSPPARPPAPPGAVIDQKFRDRTATTIAGRLDYAVSPATAVFASVSADKREYKHAVPAATSRDSDGIQALVGVNFEITNLTRGDIGLGYVRQSFDAPGQKDLKGFSADARLEWFPTQLTTVTLTGSRTVDDSAVPGAAAFLSTNLRARVDHELLRNVILSGQVGYGKDEYTGIVREDRRKSAGLAASYLINRTLGVSATYDYSEQETRKGTGNNYKDNRVGVALTVQY